MGADDCADGEICEIVGDVEGGCVSAPIVSEITFPANYNGNISISANTFIYSLVKFVHEVILQNNMD